MNEWSPPAGATPQQYTGGKDPDGSVQLADAIAKIRTTLGDLPHHLLEQAGIRVEQDLVRFTGAVDITSTTHIGGTLDVDADATFGGAVAITGTLDLPAGIINNDALASPVSGDTATSFAVGLHLTATEQSVAAVSVNVPAGFSKARVMAFSTLSAGSSSLDCFTRIQGNDGGTTQAGYGFGASSHAITLTGLSGGTITASTVAQTWPDTTSQANTTIFVVFLR